MEITVQGKKTFIATGGKPFDKDKPAVILIHGAGMDHTVWYLQSRYFAHHGRSLLAVDLPGHGRSEGPVIDTIGGMADWIVAVMDELGIEKASLAGHSMGALISLETASRAPERINGIGLLGVAALMKGHPELIGSAERNDHLAFDLVNSWGHGKPAHIGGHQQPGLWMMGGVNRLLERSGPGVLHNDLVACDQYETAAEAAQKVKCKATLILGKLDMMAPPRNAKALQDNLADCETILIDACGHTMMIEKPGETLDAMKRVL